MILEVPFGEYINENTDISLNTNILPLSIEIVPHSAIIINDVTNQNQFRNADYTNTFAYKCNGVIFIIFACTIIASLICFLFLLSK